MSVHPLATVAPLWIDHVVIAVHGLRAVTVTTAAGDILIRNRAPSAGRRHIRYSQSGLH